MLIYWICKANVSDRICIPTPHGRLKILSLDLGLRLNLLKWYGYVQYSDQSNSAQRWLFIKVMVTRDQTLSIKDLMSKDPFITLI